MGGCNRSMTSHRALTSYLIFRCRFAQGVFCAVSRSDQIPDFLPGAGWRFVGTLGKRGLKVPGFKPSAAGAATRNDGFYLFVVPLRE